MSVITSDWPGRSDVCPNRASARENTSCGVPPSLAWVACNMMRTLTNGSDNSKPRDCCPKSGHCERRHPRVETAPYIRTGERQRIENAEPQSRRDSCKGSALVTTPG